MTVLSALKGAMSTRSLKVSPILRDTESRFRTILRTAGEAAKADRGTRARSKMMAAITTANDLLIAMIPSASNYRCLSKGGAGTVFNRWDKYIPIIIVVFFAIAFYVDGDCSYKQNIYNVNPIVLYVCGMMGVLGVVFLSKILHNLPFIAYWGRYSLMILVTHALLLQVYMPIARRFLSDLPQVVMAAIVLTTVMFSYQLIIPLMNRFLPYFTAQKDLIDVSKFTKK